MAIHRPSNKWNVLTPLANQKGYYLMSIGGILRVYPLQDLSKPIETVPLPATKVFTGSTAQKDLHIWLLSQPDLHQNSAKLIKNG